MAQGEVRYCTTEDGVRIAYIAAPGGQPAIVLANNQPYASISETDLTYYAPLVQRLNSKYACAWYDGRGYGYSDREVTDFSLDARMRDLDAVVASLGADRVILVGTAQSTPVSIAW